jgi:hypothetical protein
MKNYLRLSAVLLLFAHAHSANSQTLGEKIAAKKAALEAKLNGSSEATKLDPNTSQAEVAAGWSDGTYSFYRFNGEASGNSGTTTLKFTKEEGKVVSLVQGDGEYRADEEGKSEFVRYFKSNGDWNIVFTEKWAFIFTCGRDDAITGQYFIEKAGRYSDSEMIKQYLIDAKVNQTAELAAYNKNEAAIASKAADEEKAEWSIAGKGVAKIEITNVTAPDKFGYFRGFNFQVKATLKDGKTISTKDGGYWSDYKMSFQNADYKGRTIEPTSFVKDDKIVVTVTSEFDPSVKATVDVVLNYDEALSFTNNAKNWGTSANDYKIEIKQVKHASNGSDILMYRVTDLDGYDPVKVFKLRADQTFNFTTDGANGYKTQGTGNETGPGANAGNGGNITVIKDPSVKSYDLNYSMQGGTGGAGTYGYNRGADGRDGTFKEEVKAVNF